MSPWSGAVATMQVGCNWTYKLQLEEKTDTGLKSHLVLGQGVFPSQDAARAAGEAHLKTEIDKRAG